MTDTTSTRTSSKSYGPPRCVFALLLGSTFAMGIEYAILMPTVWRYVQSVGGSQTYLGILLSGFSFTRTLSFVFVGYWSDRRPMREPFIFSFLIGAVGNFIYGIAGGLNSYPMMLFGRLIAGIGAANTTLNQSYIARTSSPDQRTKLMSLCRGCAILGIAAGPVLNLFLLRLDDVHACNGRFCLDSMTSAGYIMVCVNVCLGVLFMLFFTEPPPQARDSSRSLSYHRPVGPVGGVQESKYSEIEENAYWDDGWEPVQEGYWEPIKTVLFKRAGWFCLLVNFVTGFQMTALETAITPITKDQYGWGTQNNSYLFAGITAVAICSIVSTIVLDKQSWCSPRGIILIAQFSLGISFALGLAICGGARIPVYGLLVFGLFLVYGVVLQGPPAMAVYSTMVGEYDKGVFMGYSQIVLGIARMLGPLFAGVTLEFHTHWLLFSILCAVYAMTPISFPFVWSKIVKHEEDYLRISTDASDDGQLHDTVGNAEG
eukprot:CAMPEP_0184502710 /NCGR_PEP_ID=MMETSP0113_2-20130426/51066_1 /TAXON_ID=91329 /ORGANISM="Norrisiella sphaerica, Strain BC52" /LENGTH=485 /DNA_ID=CAMNT_0026892011 /DNA_START=62 /DNA_END=1519 /DNA_ORIENTATION=-